MSNFSTKIELASLKASLREAYDIFICSGSYEERSKSIPSQFEIDSFNKVFVCYNRDHENQVGKNASELFNMFGSTAEYIELESSNQLQIADTLFGKLSNLLSVNDSIKILVDISTFKRQTLLILLRVLRSILTKKDKVTFVYSPAEEYSVGLKDEDKWLSKNITDVHSVLGYSGILKPTRPIHLIILVGLEYERALSLIYEYEPAIVSIGYPSQESSMDFKHQDLNLKKVQLIRDERPHSNIFQFLGNDVSKIQQAIEKQIDLYKTYNTILSPMNNKISTLAAAMVAFVNKSVQITYASAAFYNFEYYSKPGKYCFIVELDDFINQ